MEALSVGAPCRLTLTGLAVGGEAIGRLGNFVLFVRDGVPGDEVDAEIIELRKNYGRARIQSIHRPSPDRVVPPCPIFYQCGGCQLQHVDYAAQLLYKRRIVDESIQHVARLQDVPVADCIGADDPWYYRNKVQFVVGPGPSMGLYARNTHQVVAVDTCAIQHPLNNRVLEVVGEALKQMGWDVYDESTEWGLLRHVAVRTSSSENEVLVTLVVTRADVPKAPEFVHLLRSRIPELRGVLLNINTRRGNTVLSPQFHLLWGEDHIVEVVDGLRFRISAGSFFQVNRAMLQKLYGVLDRFLPLRGDEMLLDAYCGTGSLSLWLGRKARRVIGIEVVAGAIDDARLNAEMNSIRNVEFEVGTVERILPQLYERGIPMDAVVMDPPRKGCEASVLETISRMQIPRIVYVSCNPSTLARDLGLLSEVGYTIEEIQPLDMFPHTSHVEAVARLVRNGGGPA